MKKEKVPLKRKMAVWLPAVMSVIILVTALGLYETPDTYLSHGAQMSWYNPVSWFQNSPAPNNSTGLVGQNGNPVALPKTSNSNAVSIPQLNTDVQNGNLSPFSSDVSSPPATTNNVSNTPGNQMASGTGGGGGSANANGGSNSFLPTFQGALNTIQGAYNGLFGQGGQPGTYDNAVGSANANVQQGYQAQANSLGGQYAQASNQMPWELVGRGAGNSSWADNNINYANQQFNNSNQQLAANEQADLAKNISAENQAKSTYGQDIKNWNDPQFQAMLANAPSYVQSEQYSNEQQALANLAGTAGANQPIPAELAQLNRNPTYQQQGGTNIGAALQALANTPTTTAAQNQIAQGIIGNIANPGVWSNYWQQVQQNPNTPVPGA